MNNAVMNIHVQVFIWVYTIFSLLLGVYLGVELLGPMYSMFNILRNCQTVFQSSCIILHFYQQHMRVPFSLPPHQHLLLPVFFIIAILVCVKYCLIVVLISISLIASGVEHLFIGFLAIYMSSYIFFGKMSTQILCPFCNWLSFAIELLEFLIHSGY